MSEELKNKLGSIERLQEIVKLNLGQRSEAAKRCIEKRITKGAKI